MKSATFKCKVITPMFMAGADGRTLELRPSEFKGMIRFWWRAIKAEDDIGKLREAEAEIFGGTGKGEGKSKVQLRIIYDADKLNKQKGSNLKSDYSLDWRFNRNTKTLEGKNAGIGYILYSTVLPKKERTYIKDGFDFDISLSSLDESAFKNAIASLWFAIYFGGFGTRARRGGGNISILELLPTSENLPDFILKEETPDKIANWLKNNYIKASKIILSKTQPEKFAVSYSNLSFSRFIISNKSFNRWQDALNDAGDIFRSFRDSKRGEIFDTAIFGLPVVHRHGKVIASGDIARRASPLILKCTKSQNKYYWLVIRLSGEFLPQGSVLKFDNKTQKPDYRLLDEFWQELKNKGNEHILSKPEILDTIVSKIKSQTNPNKIILFGSRARGDAHKNADIDLALETNKGLGELSLSAPVDIINLNSANEELKNKIKREGVTIYERKG